MNYNQDYFTNVTVKDKRIFETYHQFLRALGVDLKQQTVLDIGCATGGFLEALASENTVYGVDIAPYAIEECKKKFPTQADHFRVHNVDQQPLELSVTFDLITMFDVIEHLRNFTYLKELVDQKLKTGGLFVVTTPNANNFVRFIDKTKFTGEIDQTHTNLFTAYTMDFFLRKFDFQKVALFTPYSFHFKQDFWTEKILLGGQIFAAYKKV